MPFFSKTGHVNGLPPLRNTSQEKYWGNTLSDTVSAGSVTIFQGWRGAKCECEYVRLNPKVVFFRCPLINVNKF